MTPATMAADTAPGVGPTSSVDRVRRAYRRLAEVDRPEVWITLLPEEDLLARARAVDDRRDGGEELPLAGLLVAVKDNIDVAGVPTTAACPSYAYVPTRSAPAVERLVAAGALVVGKTNLDQFATGLVGTRSPYGAVRHASRPDRIAGGSSSGSAVAVALEVVDLALGTDTAGSGRVPAGLHGIVGLKPTLGLVPTRGVVPAARSYDCVSVFARTLSLARRGLATITGPDPEDPTSRRWPASVRLATSPTPHVAIPDPASLAVLPAAARKAFDRAVATLGAAGAQVREIDLAPFLAAARLLYGGALVAERYAAVGEFLSGRPDGLDPTVDAIISAAGALHAHDLVRDRERLDALRLETRAALDGVDALLVPTTVGHPTLAEVAAAPVEVNSRLGTYTNFVNLLDLCAAAVPAGTADGSPFGVTVVARAFEDQIAHDVAALVTDETLPGVYPDHGVDVVVFGVHMRGEPLHRDLVALGARFRTTVRTASEYRMVVLPGAPAKPGVVPDPGHGAALDGERWTLSPAALGALVGALDPPMTIGPLRLEDGEQVLGFQCAASPPGARDITRHGSWHGYRRSGADGELPGWS